MQVHTPLPACQEQKALPDDTNHDSDCLIRDIQRIGLDPTTRLFYGRATFVFIGFYASVFDNRNAGRF